MITVKRLLIVVALHLLNSSLYAQVMSPDEYNLRKNAIGMHYSGLIKQIGPYTRKAEDGLGGNIYSWIRNYDEIHFYCNSKGVVYDLKYVEYIGKKVAESQPNYSYLIVILLVLIWNSLQSVAYY
jgi:hypothetical protein